MPVGTIASYLTGQYHSRGAQKICNVQIWTFVISIFHYNRGEIASSSGIKVWYWAAPKKIKDFRIVRIEIATVAYGSFAMTLLVHFLLHTSWESGQLLLRKWTVFVLWGLRLPQSPTAPSQWHCWSIFFCIPPENQVRCSQWRGSVPFVIASAAQPSAAISISVRREHSLGYIK